MAPVGRLPLQRSLGNRRERLLDLFRLGALAALLWGVANELQPRVPGRFPWVGILMGISAVGWIGWMGSRHFEAPARTAWPFLALMALSGGALAAYGPVAVGLVAVAALGAGISFEALPALGVAAIGAAAVVICVLGLGTPGPTGLIVEGSLSAAAGLMAGATRRQYTKRAEQAEKLLAESVRADTERDRAATLAERNRIGREVHDVLAHSLGALSVQLDAADALLESGDDPDKARRLVQQARLLAVRGLEETRQAVHALRDDPVALAEQLSSLAAHDGADLVVTGSPRPLQPDAGLALYRAAQEALTNARKHAPGASVSIRLGFEASSTFLSVTNGPAPNTALTGSDPTNGSGPRVDTDTEAEAEAVGEPKDALRDTGGGFGLRGMRERIELLGGHVVAEPRAAGWTVEVAVPL